MESKPDVDKKKISWRSISIIVLVLVMIAVCSFGFYKISLLNQQLKYETVTLQLQVTSVKKDIAHLTDESHQAIGTIDQNLVEVKQILNSDKNTWRIIQAQYFIKLADAELQYKNNSVIAIQLLQSADKQIQELNDPRLDVIRKALAQDIVALQAVPTIDYTGLFLKLNALDNQVNTLPTLAKPTEGEKFTLITNNNNEPWWKKGLIHSWEVLQKIVIIRYHVSGNPPFVTPDQQAFLVQNCHALFQHAMWAVLNKQPEIYHASLQQVSQWVSNYFITDAPQTRSLLDNVNELQKVDINPTVPKVTASLQAFDEYLSTIKNP